MSQLLLMITSTQPAWEAGASCTGGMGLRHRGASSVLAEPPPGAGSRGGRRKIPLSGNNF